MLYMKLFNALLAKSTFTTIKDLQSLLYISALISIVILVLINIVPRLNQLVSSLLSSQFIKRRWNVVYVFVNLNHGVATGLLRGGGFV